MKEILYLSFDSLQEGVGASQVLAYMRKIVKIRPVTIISFEKNMPTIGLRDQVQQDGLNWTPLPFGRFGVIGGINRVIRMSRIIDRGKIIHARSTSAGIAALIRFPQMWIWDCRSLQADQRLALSANKRKSHIAIKLAKVRSIAFLLALIQLNFLKNPLEMFPRLESY